MKEEWFNKTVDEVKEELETDINSGLTKGKVNEKLATYGLNELKAQKKKSLFIEINT